jgi:2,3-bisphosphoglycerate-independent phosphoglycerate mutase
MPRVKRPVVLIVRDGWGVNPNPEHDKFNAVKLARTPVCSGLLRDFPWTLIHTSGEDVGLPEGTMGNSEVGHQNLGAGRIVDQESVRITKAIRTGTFFDNAALVEAVTRAKQRGRYVHLFGIASDAGVHGLMTHLYACMELCKRHGHSKVALHLFTDGRDTGPYTGKNFIAQIQQQCQSIGVGVIASVCGRYYAMDRDNRWERVKRAYDLLTGRGDPAPHFATAADAVKDYYDHPTNASQQGDEFITPRCVGANAADTRVRDGDSVIFYNYRGDRPREIIRAFVMPEFLGQVKPSPDSGAKGFDRGPRLDLLFVTLTAYEEALSQWVKVAYPKPPKMRNIAGEYLSGLGLRQFRCAETEKFPHVTFFFNDYREEPFPGESRQMAQSPKVATYDLKPQMSAEEICRYVCDRLAADDCEDFILVNFANGDMVGHTGKLDAAIVAVETVDACVGRILDAAKKHNAALIVTADHGNAEQMFDPTTNAPHTAHTTYDVECIVAAPEFKGRKDVKLRSGGRLADVLPTALDLLDLPKPQDMEGQSLLEA